MAYLFGVPNHDFLVGAVGSRMWLWGVVYYDISYKDLRAAICLLARPLYCNLP